MDGTAKIRLVAFGLVLLLSGGCSKFSEEPRPNSLLPSVLPDIQVPLSDSGTGKIDIATANHLLGAYSIKFGTPRHGRIDTNPAGTEFKYIANSDFRGQDTATYSISRNGGDPSTGKLIFYTSTTVCYVTAKDDAFEFMGSQSNNLDVLANDDTCGTSITISSLKPGTNQAERPWYRTPDNKQIFFVPTGDWYGSDSTEYTICRNGFCSTAKVKVTRIDCAERFQPKDDTVYYPPGLITFRILKAKLLENDISCGDLNPTSPIENVDLNRLTFHGDVTTDRQDERYFLCTLDSTYMDPGYFTYVVRRQGFPVGGKSAKVFVKRR